MKKLMCEMCGSTEIVKVDGLWVCQFCECKYSPDEAKKLMLEGKVEITKGEAEKERLTQNAKTFLSLKAFAEADKVFSLLINDYPEYYYGWYGKFCLLIETFDLKQIDQLLYLATNICLIDSSMEEEIVKELGLIIDRIKGDKKRIINDDYISIIKRIKNSHFSKYFQKDFECIEKNNDNLNELMQLNEEQKDILCRMLSPKYNYYREVSSGKNNNSIAFIGLNGIILHFISSSTYVRNIYKVVIPDVGEAIKMVKKRELQRERRAKGFCIECGGKGFKGFLNPICRNCARPKYSDFDKFSFPILCEFCGEETTNEFICSNCGEVSTVYYKKMLQKMAEELNDNGYKDKIKTYYEVWNYIHEGEEPPCRDNLKNYSCIGRRFVEFGDDISLEYEAGGTKNCGVCLQIKGKEKKVLNWINNRK